MLDKTAYLQDKEMGDELFSPRNILEAIIRTIPTPPKIFSLQENQLLPKNDVVSTTQNPENLQVAFFWNKDATKSKLEKIIHLRQWKC